jgi:hypothetical protein
MAESRKKTGKPKSSDQVKLTADATKANPAKAIEAKATGKNAGAEKPGQKSAPGVKPDSASGAKTDKSSAHDPSAYEVVSPPAPIDRSHKGFGFGSFMMILIFIGLFAGGAYITWPNWSPYVADRFPILEYKQAPDPVLSKLTDRINALEAEAQDRGQSLISISEMEKERARLQSGVKSLLGRLDELEGAVSSVKQMIVAAGNGADSEEARLSFQRISERLAELEKNNDVVAGLAQRMSEIETIGKGGADSAVKLAEEANQRLNQAVTKIESRITEFEKERDEPAAVPANVLGPAAVVAIGQLRKTILSGQPFAKDLEAVHALSADDHGMKAALLVLNKHAGSGVATLADLRERFSRQAGTIVAATNIVENGGWVENATNRLRSFISIRQVDGSAPADSIDSYVQRADGSLKAGDLENAVKIIGELEGVSTPAAKAAADWLEAAKARLSAERAVSSLHVYAVSLIAATRE